MELLQNNYKNFLQSIEEIIFSARQEIALEVSQKQLEMAWNIGKKIAEYSGGNELSAYGQKIIPNLARDVQISERTLHRMHGFYKLYPELPLGEKLNWTHYRSLISIKDDEDRQYFTNLIEEKNLSAQQLQKVISEQASKPKAVKQPISKLKFERGVLFNYLVKEINGKKFLDLGFNIFKDSSEYPLKNFEEGQLVESSKDNSAISFKKSTALKRKIHTYRATLERVVDGDTIRVFLDLGFGVTHREILRLAKISAPERGKEGGAKATKKLEEILKGAENLIIKTNKTDMYGRYIADVFLGGVEGEYVNQMLLDAEVVQGF